MRTISILTIATVLFVFIACDKTSINPDGNAGSGLEIEITGFKNDDGLVQLQLTDEDENVLKNISAEIVEKKSTITIKDLSYGKYTFKYFHDENANEELDTHLGIPQEGYGFSNNAASTFGPPRFEDMIFEFNEPMSMKCTISYLF